MDEQNILTSLRETLRLRQDLGLLPVEGETGRRFHVMATEIAAPVFREMVTVLCLEGLSVHLLMALDETPPYIGIQIHLPRTFLCVWPSPTTHELISSLQGGPHLDFRVDRTLSYRGLTPAILESVCAEQLCLVLCPPQPII